MIKNCTPVEKEALSHGHCPDCDSDTFLLGPRGIACQNIQCARCGSKFNVLPGMADVFAERLLPDPPRPEHSNAPLAP